MISRSGQTFCITHSPLFLKCCEQGNSKQSISQAVLSPMASASSGGRAIPKPLQLKWHVPNGDPSVYGRVMIPFFWILSGSSVEFVVPSWFLNRKGLSPPALFAFIFPLFFELMWDWESDSRDGISCMEGAGAEAPTLLLLGGSPCTQTPRGCQKNEFSSRTDALALGPRSTSQPQHEFFGRFLRSVAGWGLLCSLQANSALCLWPNWHSAAHLGDCCLCCSKIVPFHYELLCFFVVILNK